KRHMNMAEADTLSASGIAAESEVKTATLANAKEPRRWGRLVLMLSVPLLIALVGGYFWMISGRSVETDNAYVQQDKLSIAAEIGGRIITVAVAENQQVKKGDLLFVIDPEPFKLAIRQADASIASAQVDVQSQATDYQATSVNISAAREDIAFAQSKLERQKALWDRGFTTRADYDAAQHAVAQAQEQLRVAVSAAAQAKAKLATAPSLPGQNPAVAAARVNREQAMLNLSRTEVRAPMDGRVTQADRLIKGQLMISGLPALTLVADKKSWIEANFKETDLANMQIGQKAKIKFDAYPELVLEGHVASIGAGTGSEFSILPAQNATGNWVKVTQRVPVRIAIDSQSSRALIAGLSATVTVDVRKPAKN
ncbi:MAG: HlyD family secretion protein, partial [Pontixanthobacter sp.]